MYYRSLKYGIVVDDILNRKKHNGEKGYPVNSVIYRIIYALNGFLPVKSIMFDRMITICLNMVVSVLIYFVFNNLPAALLFGVNLGNNQVNMWLNGKRYAVNAILCLLAFHFGNFGILFWLCTAMFQVSAISFPVVMMLSGCFLPIVLVPLLFVFGNKNLLTWMKLKRSQCKVASFVNWNHGKIIWYFKTISFYFLRGIFPYIPTMYPEQFKRFGMIKEDTHEAYRFDFQALAGLLIVVMTIAGYLVNKDLFFGMAWWLITISVFGNLYTLTVPLAERYMYLPNIGLMLFLTSFLSVFSSNAWVLFFVIYASRTYTFMPMYRNIDEYFKHHCFYYPQNDQCWIFRINKCTENKDVFGMMNLSNEGLVANQDSSWLWLQRAIGFVSVGQKKLASDCVEMAKKYARDEYKDVVEPKINEVTKMIGA